MLANRSAALRRTSAFAALLAFEVGAVVVLHRLGALPWLRIPLGDLGSWLQAAAPEDVIAAVARLVALAAAWWLLASTSLYVLARLTRVPAAIRAAGWVTLPALRRVADQALALTLATSLVSGGANAALLGPAALGPRRAGPVVAFHDPVRQRGEAAPTGQRGEGSPTGQRGEAAPTGQRGEAAPSGHQPEPAGSGAPGYVPRLAGQAAPPSTTVPPPTYTPRPAGPPEAHRPGTGPGQPGPQTPPSRPDVHRVRPGDNLWVIARDRLAQATGRDDGTLPEREVARYWLEVVEANRAELRSGDPDLIFPGELIRLPPVGRRER
jgi:nucleoid-associated protein YgaU